MNRLLPILFLLLNFNLTSFAASARITAEEAFNITPKKLRQIKAYAEAQKPTRQTVHWALPKETKLTRDYSRKLISYPLMNYYGIYGEAADLSEKLDIGDSVFIKVHDGGFGKGFIGLATGSYKNHMTSSDFTSSRLPLGYLGLAYKRDYIDHSFNKSQNCKFLVSESATKGTFTLRKLNIQSSFVIGFHLKEGQNQGEFLVQTSLNGTIISHEDLVPADFKFPLLVSAFIPQNGFFEIIDIFHSGFREKREKKKKKAEEERLLQLKEERTDYYDIEDFHLSKKGWGLSKKYLFFIKSSMERPWTVSKAFYNHTDLVLMKARGEQRKQLAKPEHLRSKVYVTVDTKFLENYRKAKKGYDFQTNSIFGVKIQEPSESSTEAVVVATSPVTATAIVMPLPVAVPYLTKSNHDQNK